MSTGLQKPNLWMLLAIWRICLLECVRALRAYGRSASTARVSICNVSSRLFEASVPDAGSEFKHRDPAPSAHESALLNPKIVRGAFSQLIMARNGHLARACRAIAT
jgi:hypothetical protein